jgi:hypothetical protein
MAIRVQYEDPTAIANLAFAGGQGEYRRFREQMAQQAAMQAASLAQQDLGQRRALAANQMSQQRAMLADLARQNQEYVFRGQQAQFGAAQDQQRQQQGFEQQMKLAEFQQQAIDKRYSAAEAGDDLRSRRTLYGSEMDNIRMLEEEGWQYSPEQERYLTKLSEDFNSLAVDPATTPEQLQQAEMDYWGSRARVRPMQPKPKTTQEVFEESLVEFTHPTEGWKMFGTMGERNGAPVFNPIEPPKQEKPPEDPTQPKTFADISKLQESMYKAADESRQLWVKADEEWTRAMAKHQPGGPPLDDAALRPHQEAIRAAMLGQREWIARYGDLAKKYAPTLAQEFEVPGEPIGGGGQPPVQANQEPARRMPGNQLRTWMKYRAEERLAGADAEYRSKAGASQTLSGESGVGWGGWNASKHGILDPAQVSPSMPRPPEGKVAIDDQQFRAMLPQLAQRAQDTIAIMKQRYGGEPPESAADDRKRYQQARRVLAIAGQGE